MDPIPPRRRFMRDAPESASEVDLSSEASDIATHRIDEGS
jgi:hypothetical protein